MTRFKNWLKLFSVLILTAVFLWVLLHYSIVDVKKIQNNGSDFQYNIISTASIIAGFLFTGISILISALGAERIKRLWEHNYLDNLYRAAFIGMLSDVITIVVALILLCINLLPKQELLLYKVELSSLIVSIIFFAWSFYYLINVVIRLKGK